VRNLAREERKKLVLDAAEKVIARKGFSSTTMEDVSRSCGLGMRSLYSLFPSKGALFAAVAERKAEEIRKCVEQSIEKEKTPPGKVRALLLSVLAMRERNREMFRFYVFERHLFEWEIRSELGEKFHNLYRDLLLMLSRLIEEGVKAGDFSSIEPELGASILMGGINTITYLWLYNEEKRNLMEEGEKLWEFFMKAVGKRSEE